MKSLRLAGFAAMLLLAGAGCAGTATLPTTDTAVQPSDSTVVTETAPVQKATSYLDDQGVRAAEAAGWTKFENKTTGGPSASFYLPTGLKASCAAGTDTYTCSITKAGTVAPKAFVIYYKSSLDSTYETDGFSSSVIIKQYGYNDGSEFFNTTMKSSTAFGALTGVSYNTTPINAFTFSNLETAPYSVLVLDPNANWGIGDWTTFLSTVTVLGKE